ncbi:hypothetical protein [Bradymonas sediminis]|uniref:Uncharacterized protein n=1 Tax=Bradymonas sediminis TaxID=1548548 RepID=A0A2Z4FJN6_9DELT|nr:hypothetical protein [Bradymonas sediminis]AWV88926.1 hypothetical protein DN745_06060 [Bradymonas sediminis]TDP71935.1 hypothetical protein DFR33_108149 [Bradymonas sediminis]
MKIEDALKPEVSPYVFFTEYVPELFEARRELFCESSEVDVIVSVYFSDTDARYTCEFRADGCTVECDEMIDFPVATIIGNESDWEDFKRHMLEILVPLERRANDYRDRAAASMSRLTAEFLEQLERFDGVFECTLTAEGLDAPIEVELVLNDYDAPDGAARLRLGASFETGMALATGEIFPTDLPDRVRVGGELSLGLEIGGLLLKHFPELESRG